MNCGYNEAEYHFAVNWMGTAYQIHLCEHCKNELTKQYMNVMSHAGSQVPQGTQWPFFGQTKKRTIGQNPFPADAGHEVKQKRHLKALQYKLKNAIEEENYELAIQLRDELKQMEEEVNL